MPLISTETGKKLESAMISFILSEPGPGFNNTSVIESIIDADFQLATPSMDSVVLTPPAGTFRMPRNTSRDNPMVIGLECARYWSLAVGLGTPQILSKVDSVVNDADKIAAPIAANLISLSEGKIMRSSPYSEFIDCIYREVKKIIWTVTEASSTTTTTYTVTVS